MNQVNYFVLAESVVTDEKQGTTIVNLFNRLATKSLPLTHPKITLAFGFYPPTDAMVDGKIMIKLQIVNPAGKVIADITGTGRRSGPQTSDDVPELTGSVDLSDGLVLRTEGLYKARLICGDTLLAENKFVVSIQKKGASK